MKASTGWRNKDVIIPLPPSRKGRGGKEECFPVSALGGFARAKEKGILLKFPLKKGGERGL